MLDGKIVINGDFIIGPDLTKKDFLLSALFRDVLKQDDYEYTQYYLKPQIIDGKPFVIRLIFDSSGKLNTLSISFCFEEKNPSWEQWTQEKEYELKKIHDDLLKVWFGKSPYKFSWGTVSSVYDPRSASSYITIIYT